MTSISRRALDRMLSPKPFSDFADTLPLLNKIRGLEAERDHLAERIEQLEKDVAFYKALV